MKNSPSDEYPTNISTVGASTPRTPNIHTECLRTPCGRPPSHEKKDIWQNLKTETRPIFLYGTGNGADKILDALLVLGITPAGVFASDGFVRNRVFRGYEVVSYSAVREKYGDDIVVLLCFGTDREEVVSFIEELDERHTLYVPDVPLYGGEIFDLSYFERNYGKLMRVREMLTDETSKEYFDAAVNFRLSGKYKYLKLAESPRESLETLLDTENIRATVDLGAYKGDTAKLFFDTFKNSEAIYAVEPDPKTFMKLCAFAEDIQQEAEIRDVEAPSPTDFALAEDPGRGGAVPRGFLSKSEKMPLGYSSRQIIRPLNFAASDREGEITYSGSASRGAGVQGKNHRAKETIVKQNTLDSLNLEKVDFIKYDVEGDEAAALVGSTETIKRCRPSLSVSLYHKTDDLFELPLKVYEMLSSPEDYTFHLRRPWCIPCWDLSFYAVQKQHKRDKSEK